MVYQNHSLLFFINAGKFHTGAILKHGSLGVMGRNGFILRRNNCR